MKITELLRAETMILNLAANSKNDVIEELTSKLDENGYLSDRDAFKAEIDKRESESSTGIGEGVAIPHAKTSAVKTPSIVFGRSEAGIDYDSLDGQPSHLFFMIAASEGAHQDHLHTLSRLSTLLMDESFRKQLLEAKSKEAILSAIDEKEKEKLGSEEESSEESKSPRLLGVTGCPTGIAHTYMAADGLKDEGKNRNISIKVETNGSDGVKNPLTAEEIAAADAIIIAADTKVETDRFDGKPLIQASVGDGIRNAASLFDRAMSKDAPVHKGSGGSGGESTASSSGGGGGFGFYKHLMNGVSHMLPFVVGGGILIALSFFFGVDAADPESSDYNAFAAALDAIGGEHAFGLMVAVLAGFIAMSIADRPGLAPGMVGGFMATTGDAGFIGGIIAGFLAGYLILGLKKLFSGLPATFDGIKTILFYPLISIFVIGIIMHFVLIEPLAAFTLFLQNWLDGMQAENIAILGVILGGMMAVDLGGPVNKAAFTFGLAMIDAGQFGPHAAVMAGGMVPPLGIALATTIFKNKFTVEQRDSGRTNYILGSFFVTEGAIPFAAADPGRVLPSAIVGSSVAGGLSLLFGVTLQAGHGGLITMATPAVTNTVGYIIAIVVGAIVTGLMLGFWKKTLE
ncbi:PTS fructose transporter subunit IIABC [Natribacillus halophilus]|uniref:PTS system D-fructose-specific IIA component (F1P-forming), Frc family /PTS system D-fructose-specific IIB component (F1P-forming), Frc family /PTS system D-fructose-specific IIC component (F1P-for... n=1 Tax=Natribacillus halophilus TaxID=549003 RepID=A0A1G8SBF7_9BACI|nr:fructose-specific PTS transporter subunit EIIC [Natribacillus halophilus]SDJ26513.1 PTS system D-fructose-specific IIA component (F1P-forming), Frc family /PTS system D-fructose-specific IIB component (F1P-forming), Frc family /PTS system D-fructose-specific IIC component (F1P-forming), Frc family [Natribacillus halophilus]